MADNEENQDETPEETPGPGLAPEIDQAQQELLAELIEGLIQAVDQRYDQHMKSSVLPLAQRMETLAQGFAQLFALMKHNRRDTAALEAMKVLLRDPEFMMDNTAPQIAEFAYLVGDAMEEQAATGEVAAAEAIHRATEELRKAREQATQAKESPRSLARRLSALRYRGGG